MMQLLLKADEVPDAARVAAGTTVSTTTPPASAERASAGAVATGAAGAAVGGAVVSGTLLHPLSTPLQWTPSQLPLVELLELLSWLQQHVVRLQLPPGGCADLHLDPSREVYAALRVPALAMQGRPTLLSSDAGVRQHAENTLACRGRGVKQ
jgi:hypothetical protein